MVNDCILLRSPEVRVQRRCLSVYELFEMLQIQYKICGNRCMNMMLSLFYSIK